MTKAKVLFVNQEITPYLKESPMATIGRYLPQGIQEKGREIRTFMPRYGSINERRNQLHEVIRLSGMNLIINDSDHPLIIKVASIQSARMQIYFIDNEDYFQRKSIFHDKNNVFFDENDERVMFFSRGVLETVKKLSWAPDVIHCHGWITALVPLYVRKIYQDNPLFGESKIIVSLYDDAFNEELNKDLLKKIKFDGINIKELKHLKSPDFVSLMKTAIDYADGIIIGSENINPELEAYAKAQNKPFLPYVPSEQIVEVYDEFYNKFIETT